MGAVLWIYIVFVLMATIAISIYGVVRRPSLVKKMIALTILNDAVNFFIVFIGFRVIKNPVPPVAPRFLGELNIEDFVARAVDPTPQAFVLTAIVIGMAVTLLIAVLIIGFYNTYGTTDVRRIVR